MPHDRYRALVRELGCEPFEEDVLPIEEGETATDADGVVTIPARVPGNFELDLFAAGLIEDPFFSANIIDLTRFEDRHLFYCTEFELPDGIDPSDPDGEGEAPTVSLCFEGIDTVAEIYVNGRPAGSCDNMLIAHTFPIENVEEGVNHLMVHIRPTAIEAMSQKRVAPPSAGAFKYNYASLHLRKAPSSFGWDIMCRAVSGGIWKPVYLLIDEGNPGFEQIFLYTYGVEPDARRAHINLYYCFDNRERLVANNGVEIEIDGVCPGDGDTPASEFSVRTDVWHTCGNIQLTVENARLWYPRGAGRPDLYDVTVRLLQDGKTVDTRTQKFGIRTVELDRTSLIDESGNGEFRFKVNGKPVFVMGTNWVPLDAYHSRDAARLPRALELLDDIGCNAVRCWGGNVYESDAFFDFCDEHGIMVWQDFAMGCASYPQDADMEASLRREVVSVVRRLRGHASLCLWAGDNECDYFRMFCYPFTRNPADNVLTRKVIPDILRAEDFTRPYLPSSPYVDEAAFKARAARISEDHLWGPRDYFKGDFYRGAVCRFASETGYHGCPDPASLAEYIPEDQLWPIYDKGTDDAPFEGTPNPAYLAHQTSMELNESNTFGYRITLMKNQVTHMFRDTPKDLETFSKMSQMSQAEAFKYFIERFRTAKWERTGIIWWNLLDGWPQISDAVVNYNFRKKLAYDFIKRAQSPVLAAFSDREPGPCAIYPLHVVNDSTEPVALSLAVTSVADGEVLLRESTEVEAGGRVCVARLNLDGREDQVLSLVWKCENGESGASHFIACPEHLDYETYLSALTALGFDTFHVSEEE